MGFSGYYGRGSKGIYRGKTTPVGTFPSNAFGLHDMHGNVWEWCLDHHCSDYEKTKADGSAWIDPDAEQNTPRELRGGTWFHNPQSCRSASHFSFNPVNPSHLVGFRVMCTATRITQLSVLSTAFGGKNFLFLKC